MTWEKAWAYLTCSNVVLVVSETTAELFGTSVGGSYCTQHGSVTVVIVVMVGGGSCPLLQFSNLVLSINSPHFLWGSPWFCFGSTLFFTL